MASVFVTVGTTLFDQLIEVTNEPAFHAALWNLGYRHLIVQYGAGGIIPHTPSTESVRRAVLHFGWPEAETNALKLSAFRFKVNIQAEIETANLIISHGGAGTCVQALTPCGSRRLIVVINDTLLGNHQQELAMTLAKGRHAVVTTPANLISLLASGSSENTLFGDQILSMPCSNVKRFLGPNVPPEQAGFVGFRRGQPERFLHYLNERIVCLR